MTTSEEGRAEPGSIGLAYGHNSRVQRRRCVKGHWVPRLGLTVLCGVVCAAALFCLAVLRLLECNGVRRFELDLFIGISFGFRGRYHRSPTSAVEPAGQDPGMRLSTGTGHTSALFARKSQSLLDNVIAGFRPARSSR